MKKKEELPVTDLLLNCFQACNNFQLVGRNRRVAEMKFGSLELSVKEWELKLKEDKLLK